MIGMWWVISNKIQCQIEKMGGHSCTQQKTEIDDPLAVMFEADIREKNVEHSDDIKCRNKEMQKLIDKFVQNLKESKSLYRDPAMPTEPILLKSKTAEIKCTYERPQKFLAHRSPKENYKIIDFHEAHPNTIEVKDEVMQYFGVFLCFLSDKPNLIQKIITTDQNSYGLHGIEAYRNGRPIQFVIDDYILCRNDKPFFSQPCKMMYMWPCLIEKAWLKIRGNSAKRVEQTSPEELFDTFMPIPIEKVFLEQGINSASKSSLNKLFADYDPKSKTKDYILTSKRTPEIDIGLSGRRHFYLLDTFKYEGKRLLYLRNPCGEMPFRGLYSEVPPVISESISSRNLTKVVAGNFLIDEDEFMEQMSEVMIINYQPGNQVSTFGFTASNSEEFFIGFTLKCKGNLNLKVSQSHLTNSKNPHYFPLMYNVVKLSDNSLIGGSDNKEGCFGVKHTYLLDNFSQPVTPGKYLIRLKKKEIERSLPEVKTFLTAYFIDTISFEIAAQQTMNESWNNFLLSEARAQLASAPKNKSADIMQSVAWVGDVAVVYVEKCNPKKKEVSIEVNFPELMNLECTSHPEVRRSEEWKSYTFSDHIMFVFQKIDLTAETHIRQYHLEAF